MGLVSSTAVTTSSGAATTEYVAETVPCNNSLEVKRNFCGMIFNTYQCGEVLINGSHISCQHASAGYGGPTSPFVVPKGASICSKQGSAVMTGYFFG